MTLSARRLGILAPAIALLLAAPVFLSHSQLRADEVSEAASAATKLDAREMAAFVVAYEDYRQQLKKEGKELTPSDFTSRHYAVRLRPDGSRIEVYFYPASPSAAGGGVRYLVDATRLTVEERFFER